MAGFRNRQGYLEMTLCQKSLKCDRRSCDWVMTIYFKCKLYFYITYRKQLEMELKKLQTQIQEGGAAFDEVLQALFQKKVKTEMVIYQVCCTWRTK